MKKFLLVGNPNTGKTTLYNTITKSYEHVGNWHGVTVGAVEKEVIMYGEKCVFVDLPGLYSLDAYSMEEKISTNYLESNRDSVVINICDANNIERNLLLTIQLKQKGYNVIIAMNMARENKNIDYRKLEEELKIPVIEIDARNKNRVRNLIKKINSINLSYNVANDYQDSEIIFRQINYIIHKVKKEKTREQKDLGFIDKIVLNKFLFLPIFILIISLVFYITFGEVGSFLSSKITNVINVIKDFILGKINNFSKLSWFYHFLEDAIFGGLSSLLAFLPQVALLFFCLTFLEDVGYLPRVAALLDGLLKKVGMTGRSLFSLLMGFGCTATALITTRNLDNEKLKKRTALILPFMSCSAKLPIFLIFASAFFVKFKVLILIALYFFSIVIGIIVSAVNNKINKHQNDEVLILELPKYRLPRLSNLLKSVYINIKHFILKIGTVILISSTIIWILQCFTIKFEYVGYNYEGDNILKSISSVIYPIFRPLGFSSSLVIVVLLSGLIGKEMIISCIGLLNGVAASGIGISESIQLLSSPVYFDINSAISFILFVLLYTPCISTFEVMGKEIGYKFAIKSFIFQFIIAYIVSYIVYGLLTKNLIVILLLCIVLALSILFVIKSCRKNKSICGLGSCYGCNKTCWK